MSPTLRALLLGALILFVVPSVLAQVDGGIPADQVPPAPDEANRSASSAAAEITPEEIDPMSRPQVHLETSAGNITIELYSAEAPKSVANFLSYVRSGHYDGTIFHRVIPGFMVQGGGFNANMSQKETGAPIENEADNGLRNLRGTICMARTQEPHSATSQFFINTKDNPALDHRDKSIPGWGYAVFGKLTTGLDVMDAIEAVDTGSRAGHQDVPLDPVEIETARVVR